MHTFIVKFQLNRNDDIKKQSDLKKMLLGIGFSQNILSERGTRYVLPKNMFLVKSDRTNNEILNIAKDHAFKIDPTCRILVVEADVARCSSINLEEIFF